MNYSKCRTLPFSSRIAGSTPKKGKLAEPGLQSMAPTCPDCRAVLGLEFRDAKGFTVFVRVVLKGLEMWIFCRTLCLCGIVRA